MQTELNLRAGAAIKLSKKVADRICVKEKQISNIENLSAPLRARANLSEAKWSGKAFQYRAKGRLRRANDNLEPLIRGLEGKATV